MSTNDSEELTENYVLNRVVYINSANHGYSEIMLDTHLAMFGRNNAGKTASLAGTKLLLFPETDLMNCEEKFRFVSKQEIFSTEDSYNFYFPDRNSFIILEVKNLKESFAWFFTEQIIMGTEDFSFQSNMQNFDQYFGTWIVKTILLR